ncbi:MAG: mercury resistance system transport protein MerF [Rhodospirillales bacterium]|nr:mercury resistance system transport protein MerF [Rhodospirillales bacterium]
MGITGIIGTAICCFTPVLVFILGAIGLTVVVRWLDYILFPLMGLFMILVITTIVRQRGAK